MMMEEEALRLAYSSDKKFKWLPWLLHRNNLLLMTR
jgi:hypothetical protein